MNEVEVSEYGVTLPPMAINDVVVLGSAEADSRRASVVPLGSPLLEAALLGVTPLAVLAITAQLVTRHAVRL